MTAWIFTPEKLAVISKMRADGATSRQIALAVGSTANSVRQTMRRKGMAVTRDYWLEFRIPAATKLTLEEEATRRRMKLGSFIRRLLVTIAKDKLYAAILDDE